MEDIRIALAQINCPLGQLHENAERQAQYCRHAADAGARLICFPELSLTGLPHDNHLPHDLAQPLDGELGQTIAAVAVETGLVVLTGLLERDRAGVIYNTQLVATPKGLAGGYRKAHVANSEIHYWYHGDDLPVFTFNHLTFGIQTCYDNHFPEGSRTLALKGAEVIFCPYGSPGPCNEEGLESKRSRWLRYLPARAFDNSVYVAVVNQVGSSVAGRPRASDVHSTARDTHCNLTEFPGGSFVLDPWAEVIAKTPSPPSEDLLVVDLTAAKFREKRQDALQFFTHFRRPELYAEISRTGRAPSRLE